MKRANNYISSSNSLQHNRQTIQKALGWLRQQPQDLTSHITDVNLAVKLYLNSQKKEENNNSSFTEELQRLSGITQNKKEKQGITEIIEAHSAAFTHQKSFSDSEEFLPEDTLPLENKEKENKEERLSFLLDKKSKEALEKAQNQLNIPMEETLKALIQLGCHSLQTLLNRR